MTCGKCGRRTPRSNLCKQCARDERREEAPQGDTGGGELLTYECAECGHTYDRKGLDSCPECEAGRAVCLGPAEEVSA